MSVDIRDTDSWEDAVGRAVANLRFGSVEVSVHDGRVVQVETREKIRFEMTENDAGADRKAGGTAATRNEGNE